MPIVSTWVPDPPSELRYRLRVDSAKNPQLALYLWSCMGGRANNDLLVAVLEAGYAALMSQAAGEVAAAGGLPSHLTLPPSARSKAPRAASRAASPRPAPSSVPSTSARPDLNSGASVAGPQQLPSAPKSAPSVTVYGTSAASSVLANAEPPASERVELADDPFAGSRSTSPLPSLYDDSSEAGSGDQAEAGAAPGLLSRFISL